MVALFGLVHAGRSVRRHRLRVQRATLALTAGLVATSLAACGGSAPAGAPGAAGAPGGGAPAMPVEIVTLTPKPVEQTGEARCPYCSTLYKLTGAPRSGH